MDAITLLKQDHKTVEKLFKQFEHSGDRAHVERRSLVERITEELSVHAAVEEQVFYPVTREVVPETEDLVLESLEEHHIVKVLLSELEHMHPDDERYKAKVTVLMENVRHHVQEEEDDYFPKVRKSLGRNAMNELGEAMADARESAPTHPHPRSADTPPGNLIAGTATSVVDRVGDAVSGIAQGGVSVVGDLVARVRGQQRPRRTPAGSSDAKRVAATIRSGVEDAADQAERTGRTTVHAAAEGARSTAATARSGARGTAQAAKAGGERTRRAAKASASSKSSAR